MVNAYQRKLICSRLAVVGSIITLVAGIATLTYFDSTRYDEFRLNQLVIGRSPQRTKDWIRNPAPVLVKFYFFDITNPSAFDATNSAEVVPSFVERGPYVYEEKQEKTRVVWNKNGTVSFHKNTTYHFRRDLSVGFDDDSLVVLNTLIVAVGNAFTKTWMNLHQLKYRYPTGEFFNKGREFWKNHQHIAPKHRVKDIIWGHSNNILDLLHRYVGVSKDEFPEMDGLFGFAGTNNTQSKEFEMLTGADGLNKMGMISRWDKSDKLNHWKFEDCDSVAGWDGQLFPPNINRHTKLQIFEPKLCRRMPLEFIEERVHEGLPVYRFGVSDALFDPEATMNTCYCSQMTNNQCGIRGTFSISNCKKGYESWPLLYSKPHFLYGNPILLKELKGLRPRKEDHDSYYDIIPQLGIPVASKVRIQLNAYIDELFDEKFSGKLLPTTTRNFMKSGIYPVFWFERGYDSLTEKQLNQVRNILEWQAPLRWGLGITMLVLSLILATVSFNLMRSTSFDLNSTGRPRNQNSARMFFSDTEGAVSEIDGNWGAEKSDYNDNVILISTTVN